MEFKKINKTLIVLDNLQKQLLNEKVVETLHELLGCFQQAIDEVDHALSIQNFKKYQSKIKLCACQLSKAVPRLAQLIKLKRKAAYKRNADFLIEKIKWCLTEVLRVFNGRGCEDDQEPSGMFVKIMEEVQRFLKEEKTVDCDFRDLIDELLCQALTIAKLSHGDDYKEISSACRSVLLTLTELEASTVPIKENSLQTNALEASLQILERRVNVAVLRLFFHIGADPDVPLQRLSWKVLDEQHKQRHVSDLTMDLELMDLFCEQIQLIGHFAVACSNDSLLKVKIHSCLASIEFFENFFHSAAEEFYMFPSDNDKEGFFQFIVEDYNREVKLFTNLIDQIVDCQNFVKVAFRDLEGLAYYIKDNIRFTVTFKTNADVFLSRCFRLVMYLRSRGPGYVKLKQALQHLQMSINDKLMSHGKKRIVLCHMKKALKLIAHACNYQIQLDEASPKTRNLSCSRFSTKNQTKETTQQDPKGNALLKPYLIKVHETPRLKSSLYAVTPKKTPRRLIPMPTLNNTSLGITGILDEIQNLSDTFGPKQPNIEEVDNSTIESPNCSTSNDGSSETSIDNDDCLDLSDTLALKISKIEIDEHSEYPNTESTC